ncbi:MAG: HAMP domain-containing protein [Lachnospiraceae bacterium]
MTWWITLLVLAIFSGQFLVYLLRTLQKTLFGPLAELNCKMKIFSEGNLETRIEERVGCQEVRELTDTFNEMTGQIRNMKIENYEKKLEMQETILKYLQIQKNPHFFLNVLNGSLFSGNFWKYASSSDNYTRTDQACALCSLSRKDTGSASGGTGIYTKLCEDSKRFVFHMKSDWR